MRNYNSDGDFVGPNGIVVPGMYHGMGGSADRSSWQQIISVSEGSRQKMFDNVKKEFIQENGISNGDTTKRSDVFREYQLSVRKDDRVKGTWTLQQYEGNYRSAMYAAIKATDPSWNPGQPFDANILNSGYQLIRRKKSGAERKQACKEKRGFQHLMDSRENRLKI